MRRILAIACFLAGLLPAIAFASGGEESGLISLDKSLIIQAINFAILLWLLTRLLYKPLMGKMDERTKAIQKSLDEAQAARAQAQRIRAEALKDAADEQRRLVDAAKAEAARLVSSAREEMDQDVRRARQELRREVADLAIAVSERLIKKSLNDTDHRRIVDDAIAHMGQKNWPRMRAQEGTARRYAKAL